MTAILESMRENFAGAPVSAGGEIARQVRDKAIRAFLDAGLPAANDEHWKYTQLRTLANRHFALAAAPRTPMSTGAAIASDAIRVTFVNGHYVPELSDREHYAENGIRILHDALASDPGLAGGFLPVPDAATHRFATLNRAFMDQGLVIQLADDQRLSRPIMLIHHSLTDAKAIAAHPRLMFRAGKCSEATVIEQYTGDDGHGNLCNALTELDLGQGAALTHYRIQNEGNEAFHIGSVFARLDRDARLYSYNLAVGAKLARVDMQFELAAPGAELTMDGLYLAKDRQHLDNNTLVNHRASGTASSQDYRGIVTDRARAVFTGKAVVHQDAQKVSARQSNRNLLLSEGAEIDARPVFEIYADDVQCSHGATIGQIDDAALFYLRSRGLPRSEARQLLTFAFAEDLILRIRDDAIRNAMERHLADWLPEFDKVEELVPST